jgi:hypothetical protein
MTGRAAGRGLARLALAPDEPDQVLRLHCFRQDHPQVIIGDGGFGTFQARIPEPDGETVISRYSLRELLDKLDALEAAASSPPGAGGNPGDGPAPGGDHSREPGEQA